MPTPARRLPSLSAAVAALSVLSACGGGPGTFNGQVGGLSLAVKDSALGVRPGDDVVSFVMSDQAGLCGALQTGKLRPDETLFFAGLYDQSGSSSNRLSPGQYPLAARNSTEPKLALQGVVGIGRTDATCSPAQKVLASSGAVTVTAFQQGPSGSLRGTFDLGFETGDHASGTFDAPFCDVPVLGSLMGCP